MGTINTEARYIPSLEGVEAVRGSYVQVAVARAARGGTRKVYSLTLMFDKTNPLHMASIKQLHADLQSCLVTQWPDPKNRPLVNLIANKPGTGPGCPIKDGDVAVNKRGMLIKEKDPQYAGHYVVVASCGEDSPPVIMGANREMLSPKMCKSGYWYKVNVNAFAYVSGDGGVSVGLNGLQLIRRDDTFGGMGGPSPESMFSSVGPSAASYGDDSVGFSADDWGAPADTGGQKQTSYGDDVPF